GKATKKHRRGGLTSPGILYRGIGGTVLPDDIVEGLTRFRQPVKKGARIDVWWLYDDGGLTILIPYILTQRRQFSSASLRVFSLASSRGELEYEQRSMAALLSKFRIDCSDVVVIPDVQKKAGDDTRGDFDALIEPFKEKADES
ncbi:unnamed protein product, partial [Darwinula stevensoni]